MVVSTSPKSVSLLTLATALPSAIETEFPFRFISTGVTIVTICVAVLVFPFPSFTVQTTFVLPAGKIVGALFVKVTVPQLSVPVGVPKTTFEALQSPVSAFVVTFVGAVIVGFVVSALIITF